MRTWYFRYFQKTRNPSQNLLVVKKIKKYVTLQILKFIPVLKLINKNFPHMM